MKENYGGCRGGLELGAALVTAYHQDAMEPNKAFAERIRLHFARDLGPDWQHWPSPMRRNLVKRLIPPRDHQRRLPGTAAHQERGPAAGDDVGGFHEPPSLGGHPDWAPSRPDLPLRPNRAPDQRGTDGDAPAPISPTSAS